MTDKMHETPQAAAVAKLQTLAFHIADAVALAGGPATETTIVESFVDALDAVHYVEQRLAEVRELLVVAARDDGASWNQIGTALNTSKQGARQRYQDVVFHRGVLWRESTLPMSTSTTATTAR